ncbi:malate synthase A [bacterium]|nr:malate synthase A [bacterium]
MRRLVADVEVCGPDLETSDRVLTPAALEFLGRLQRAFGARREELLWAREERQAALDEGTLPDFPAASSSHEPEWTISPVPPDLVERKVEITGPVDRKMMINALNSGASTFMADFEDSLSPTWENVVRGQANLMDAVLGTIDFVGPDGRRYELAERTAVLMVRPRGWHLEEKHLLLDGAPLSASLVDFGLYVFHNHAALRARGTGPYFYLPKLEGRLEARLWNEVFVLSQELLGIPRGTIKATVLIETILAAFEMDGILLELREHSAGLNAGRWDYIFSVIKKLGKHPRFLLPERSQVSMTVPFMRAYTALLVETCHRRGAHAQGGMAAFVPNRRDPAVTAKALAKVREDKAREVHDGFDGTWVAHPDLVPVAREELDRVLGARPNQLDRPREWASTGARELLDARVPGGRITQEGLRTNVSVAIRYLDAWLRGTGAVAINNLMEDAATAEISRSQVWQWVYHGASLPGGARVTRALVERIAGEEVVKIRREGSSGLSRLDEAAAIFSRVALGEAFVPFLTVPAYDVLE